MADRNVTIVLPDDLIEALDLAAGELGLSRSQIIRRSCVRYLPKLNQMIEDSKPGDLVSDLLYFVAGAPVLKTGDTTDEDFAEALHAMRARLKADKTAKKPRKKRAGRPRTKGEGNA